MTRLLTCKHFLSELNAYLDEETDAETRSALEQHMNECPNCWVVLDTTKKTMKIYKGCEPQDVPVDVQTRLMAALQRKIAERAAQKH